MFLAPDANALESARYWLRRGVYPVAIPYRAKRPIGDAWQQLRLTEEDLPNHFGADGNVGILLIGGLVDLDMDCPQAIVAARRLRIPTGVIWGHLPSSPDSHSLYYASPPTTAKKYVDPFNRETLCELRTCTKLGKTQQTVAPNSTHKDTGEPIRFSQCGEIPKVPGDELQRSLAGIAAAALLAKYWPEKERNLTELALAGALARARWNEESAVAFVLATYESVTTHDPTALGTSDEPGRVEQSVRSTFEKFRAGEEVTGVPKLKEHIPPKAVDAALKWLNIATEEPEVATSTGLVVANGQPWRAGLIRTGNPPKLVSNLANITMTLRYAEEWKDTVGYSDFACRAEFLKDSPAHPECKKGYIEDEQVLWITEVMQFAGFPYISRDIVKQAVYAVAMEKGRRRHPIREYLNSLEWDGKPRLDTWLVDYLHAEDNEINRMIGAKFLIMMVARIMQPGCQADYMVVLESPQGERKSSSLRALMPDATWFTDSLPKDLGSKDAAIQLQKKWLVEAAEMDAMSRAAVSEIKAFITRQVDTFRPPHGTVAKDFPRQCCMVGSVNKRAYLKDETGARRFWTVPVGSWGTGGALRVEAIVADRDQLWAEALQRFKDKEPWHPTNEQSTKLAEIQAERYEESLWTDAVMDWCNDPKAPDAWNEEAKESLPVDILSTTERVSVAEIIQYALKKPLGMAGRKEQMEVANILTSKGWDRKQEMRDGRRSWFYFRPEGSEPAVKPEPEQATLKPEPPF